MCVCVYSMYIFIMPVITLKPTSGALIQLDVDSPTTVRNVVTSLRPFLDLNQRDAIIISEHVHDGADEIVLKENFTYHYLIVSFRELVSRAREDYRQTINPQSVVKGCLDITPFVTNSFGFLYDCFFHIVESEGRVERVVEMDNDDHAYYLTCVCDRLTRFEQSIHEGDEEKMFDNVVDLFAIIRLFRKI